jgi:hypothetical protein
MNTKAILASLILGSSSLAIAAPAAPGVSVSTESYGAADIRDHRADTTTYYGRPAAPTVIQPIDYRDHRDGWNQGGGWNGQWMPPQYRAVTLASNLRLAANSQTTISVGAQLGRFSKLEIKPTSGRTLVRQVYVQFADDQVQILRNVNRSLTGNDCLTVDLDGDRRAIKRVIVYGAFGTPSWRQTGGTFSLTAS